MLISAMTLHGMVSVASGTPLISREGGGEAKSGFRFDGRADAVYLDRSSSMMDGMLIGGETMPGVRTPRIVIFTTACDPPKFHVMIDPNYQ